MKSTSSGASGIDVTLGSEEQKIFPMAIECKATDRININAAYQQAKANAGTLEPLVCLKRSRQRPLAIMDLEWFLNHFTNEKITNEETN